MARRSRFSLIARPNLPTGASNSTPHRRGSSCLPTVGDLVAPVPPGEPIGHSGSGEGLPVAKHQHPEREHRRPGAETVEIGYLLAPRRFGLLAPSCKGRIARAKMTARRFCFTSEDKLTTLWRTYNNSTGRASKHRPIISQLNVTLTSCLFDSGLWAFFPSSPSGRES